MLSVYPRNQLDEELEDEIVEIDSRPNGLRQEMVENCEDFRSILNTECRNGNEVTDDTSRWISSEVTNQVTRKLDELKRDLIMQLMESINSAIHETMLPSLQSCVSGQNCSFGTIAYSGSIRLSRNAEGRKPKNAWENIANSNSINSSHHPRSRDGSVSCLDSSDDQNGKGVNRLVDSRSRVTNSCFYATN